MAYTMCSFCGKDQTQVRKIIAGPSVYICDSCVEICRGIIAQESRKDSEKNDESQGKSAPTVTRILSINITELREIRDRLSVVQELRDMKAISAESAEKIVQGLCKLIEESSPQS